MPPPPRAATEDMPVTRTRFTGTLADVPLASVVQTAELNGGRSVLRFTTDVGEGTLWLTDGRIVDAECEELFGEQAVYRLFMADVGAFSVHFGDHQRGGRMSARASMLLLEAARRRDEWARWAGDDVRPSAVYDVDRDRLASLGRALEPDEARLLDRLDGEAALLDLFPEPASAPELARVAALAQRGVLIARPSAAASSASASVRSVIRAQESDRRARLARQDPWAQVFANYLADRGRARQLMAAMAWPVFVISLVLALSWRDLNTLAGGQLTGWALIVLGHAADAAPERTLRRPGTILLDPVCVAAELLAALGVRRGFIGRGLALAGSSLA